MQDARLKCLTAGAMAPPPSGRARLNTAHEIAQLALCDGGMGQTALCTKAPAAYIAAMIITTDDKVCNRLRRHSRKDIEYAYNQICGFLDVSQVQCGTPLAQVLPTNVKDLTDFDFARTHLLSNPRVRVQAVITSVISKYRKNRMRMVATSQDHGVHKSDAVNILTITSRSLMPRIFASPLCFQDNRVHAESFVAYCRFYLLLPQLLTWGHARMKEPESNLTAETCRAKHTSRKVADHAGDHACSCSSAMANRYQLHRGLTFCFIKAGLRLGLVCAFEPPTHRMLNDEFTPALARALFPKTMNKVTRRLSKRIQDIIIRLQTVEDPAVYDALMADHRDTMLKIDAASPKGGLRIDCCLHIRNKTLWIDNSATHVSAACHRTLVHTMLTDEVLEGVTDFKQTSTPAVEARVTEKCDKYRPMLNRATLQRAKGMRADTVEFRPAVMTHTGEC